jgi:hypothetical protein
MLIGNEIVFNNLRHFFNHDARMAITKKANNNKFWEGYAEKRSPCTLDMGI